MRCLADALVLVALMALPQSVAAKTGEEAPTSAALAVHAKYHLAAQLMLRASYYYYAYPGCPFGARGGKCAEPTAPTAQTPLEEQRETRSSGLPSF